MDRLLFSLWNDINAQCFNKTLMFPNDIDWHPMTGNGLDAYGIYLAYTRSIGIDVRFKPDLQLASAGDARESAKFEVACRLLIHEMVHQSLWQAGVGGAGGHGTNFITEATRVATILSDAAPNQSNAAQWPDVAPWIVIHQL